MQDLDSALQDVMLKMESMNMIFKDGGALLKRAGEFRVG
jgi:hypothetical protein